jgi:hypothetical protein
MWQWQLATWISISKLSRMQRTCSRPYREWLDRYVFRRKFHQNSGGQITRINSVVGVYQSHACTDHAAPSPRHFGMNTQTTIHADVETGVKVPSTGK